MIKTKPCKYCGSELHLSLKCFKKPLKATVKRSTPKGGSKVVKKKETRSQVKKKAWEAFSAYIRTRDCLITTGTPDWGTCITCVERGCSQRYRYKELQAGHAVGGRGNAILFHEEIVNAQCRYCNQKPPMGLGGDYGNYAIALIKRHGVEHVEALQRLKGTEKKLSIVDLREIRDHYLTEVERLKSIEVA